VHSRVLVLVRLPAAPLLGRRPCRGCGLGWGLFSFPLIPSLVLFGWCCSLLRRAWPLSPRCVATFRWWWAPATPCARPLPALGPGVAGPVAGVNLARSGDALRPQNAISHRRTLGVAQRSTLLRHRQMCGCVPSARPSERHAGADGFRLIKSPHPYRAVPGRRSAGPVVRGCLSVAPTGGVFQRALGGVAPHSLCCPGIS